MCEALYDLFADELAERETKGITRGKAEAILELLDDLGKYSDELKTYIMSEKNLDTLRYWLKLAAKADSIEDFEKKSGIFIP